MHANEILRASGLYPGLTLHPKIEMGPVGRGPEVCFQPHETAG